MATVKRVRPREIYAGVQSGGTVLVCAYEDEEKCGQNGLEGSISLGEFRGSLPSLPKDKPIVFYCA